MMLQKRLLPLVLILGLVGTGCTSTIINMTKPVMITLIVNPAFDVFLTEEDLGIASDAIGGQLKLVEILLKNIKKDELRMLLCQGFTSYALLQEPKLNRLRLAAQRAASKAEKKIIDGKAERLIKRMRRFALRSRTHCFSLLDARYAGFSKAASEGKQTYAALLKQVKKEDAPILFWAGFGWGYAILNGLTETSLIAQIPQLKALMHRVVALDPAYFYGGGHLFLGTLYSQSAMLGGDIKKAKEHFDGAYQHSSNKVMLVHLYQARFYTHQIGDKGTKMCKELIKKIHQTPVDVFPKITMVNALAKELATIAMEDLDEFCP